MKILINFISRLPICRLLLLLTNFPFSVCVTLCSSCCRLWDSSSKILLAKTAFDVTIRSVAFSPDGSHVAIGHGDGSFRVLKGRLVIFLLIKMMLSTLKQYY